MANLKNITVNGVPLEKVIAEALGEEYRSHHNAEVKEMAVLASMSRPSATHVFRNHSGARSGRGRVIYSASLGGAL
jgi:hypothetical protein